MLTEDEGERAHDLYTQISHEIDELVNRMTADLSPEADEYVRTLLLETQRYWRD